jgi:hypothetical protein
MPTNRRISRINRRAVSAAGVITALALAAPVAEASAATRVLPLPGLPAAPLSGFHLPAFGGLGAFTPAPLSFVGPSIGFVGVAIGPTVIGDVFNGGTTVVVSNGPALGTTIGSP